MLSICLHQSGNFDYKQLLISSLIDLSINIYLLYLYSGCNEASAGDKQKQHTIIAVNALGAPLVFIRLSIVRIHNDLCSAWLSHFNWPPSVLPIYEQFYYDPVLLYKYPKRIERGPP